MGFLFWQLQPAALSAPALLAALSAPALLSFPRRVGGAAATPGVEPCVHKGAHGMVGVGYGKGHMLPEGKIRWISVEELEAKLARNNL